MNLNPEKRKALEAIVGKDNVDKLLSTLKSTEEEATKAGTKFKSFDESAISDIVNGLMAGMGDEVAETEKCTPGTKDGKYKAEDTEEKAEDEDMSEDDDEEDMEDDEEEDDGDMLLTESEMKSMARMIAKEISGQMAELKAAMSGMEKKMAGYRKKSVSDDPELTESLKGYLDKQDEVNLKMLETFEDIDTRLKAIESITGVGYVPSLAQDNVPSGLNLQDNERSAYNLWFSDNK